MKRIIFFDGLCPLCNGFIEFVLKKDSSKFFRYASLQSDFAKKELPFPYQSLDTVVLLEHGKVYIKSTAVLRILFQLKGLWHAVAILASVIPRPLRDFIYDIVAKNRYKFLTKKTTCNLPTKEQEELFMKLK